MSAKRKPIKGHPSDNPHSDAPWAKGDPSKNVPIEPNVSVRWLYSRAGMNETAICFRGAKFGNAVVIDFPIRVYTMPLREMDQLTRVDFKGGDYPVKRAIETFRKIQDRNGITWGAHRLLHAAELGVPCDPAELDVKPSEEQVLHVGKWGAENPDIRPDLSDSESKEPKASKPRAERPARDPNSPKRGNVLATIAAELGKEPGECRKLLRAAGMRAPYDDESAIRKVLG